MNLPEALRKQTEDFVKAVPEETVAIMSKATEDLAKSGILKNCLQPGDRAPDFTLEDSQGKSYTFSKHLNQGPLILKFFRGDW